MSRTYFGGRVRRTLFHGYLACLGIGLIIFLAWPDGPAPKEVSLSEVDRALDAGDVERALIDDDARTIMIVRNDGTEVQAAYPSALGRVLANRLLAAGIEVKVEPASSGAPVWARLGIALLPLALLVAVFAVYSRRLRSGASAFSGGRGSVAEVPETRFADIGGVDEVVAELAEVRDFFGDPERFAASGARPPRGFLLTGPPGTGKTMLARAVAGEAGVPFFALSGSDFVDTFAGVGAARIRRVFDLARKKGKAIVFIDEIDAVGKSRSVGVGGGDTDERERTLNQLLVEMDGFTQSDVIVLGATNRADMLDAALLRPGRFDRTITVMPPDRRGRTRILELTARRHKFAADVDFVELARRTPGMTGADLCAVVNEAALTATRSGVGVIIADHLESALATTVLGRERLTAVVSQRDRAISAWHEAGHAVCALLIADADDPVQVTIVPRGGSGGVTWLVTNDDLLVSGAQARARLVVAMGGRASEEILLEGDFTSGSSDDYVAARVLATHMVTRFGMSPNGVAYVGLDPTQMLPDIVHRAVNDILEDSLSSARALLHASAVLLRAIADELLDEDTLKGARLRELRLAFEPVSIAVPTTGEQLRSYSTRVDE